MLVMNRTDQGRWAPGIICDVCGKEIEEADKGMAKLYHITDTRKKILFCHKNMDGYNCDERGEDGWYEINITLFRLFHNLDIDYSKVQEYAIMYNQLEGVNHAKRS